jgi:hypothetical protein
LLDHLLKMAYHRRERSRSRERDGHYGGMLSNLPTFTPTFTGGGVSTVAFTLIIILCFTLLNFTLTQVHNTL